MATNPNMVAIQTVEVGSGGAASIEFTSIPQTYTDLYLLVSAREETAIDWVFKVKFNNSTSNLSSRRLTGNGSTALSDSSASEIVLYMNGSDGTASTFGNASIYIPNYTSSNNKSVSADSVSENNATTAYAQLNAGLWSNSAAINQITLYTASGDFAQYSSATLYGVTSAGYGAKATGGIITEDANYFYHTFLSSGTFTPTQSITADCLVVAGGGAGGRTYGGGGGAGGLLAYTSQSLTATGYTVTVGAGGVYSADGTGGVGGNGSNSQFGSLTASTGGGGGGYTKSGGSSAGQNGGSGGGGAGGFASTNGGTGTSGQGNNGGNGTAAHNASAGGGGASSAGADSVTGGIGGKGGNGSSAYSTWANATGTGLANDGTAAIGDITRYFAAGGGGAGTTQQTPSNGSGGQYAGGVVNTGQASSGDSGRNGGSGIVIVRYAR